jgi:RHS repeat-associated protein
VSYSYDEASQLTGITYQNGSSTLGNLTYGYDAAGRRISVGGSFARVNLPEAVTSSTYDAANRLIAWGSQILGYDANGAVVSDAGSSSFSYVWDARERLQSIQQGTTTIASFQYDAFNRRIGRTFGGVATSLLNDGWQVVQELNGATPTANVLTGLRVDEIFRRSAGASIEDFLTDALGSTIALADDSGVLQTTYAYESYGATMAEGDPSNNAYQYTGRENDGLLYYYRNRYYSPGMHRFISQDPIGFAGGANVYAYVAGNPVTYTDPDGLQARPPPPRPNPRSRPFDGYNRDNAPSSPVRPPSNRQIDRATNWRINRDFWRDQMNRSLSDLDDVAGTSEGIRDAGARLSEFVDGLEKDPFYDPFASTSCNRYGEWRN